MAGRNQKENADYFSHDADASADEKLIYLESKFGLKGYAVYFKFLECMTRASNFKLQWDEIKKAVYASKFGIPVTEIELIVAECCRDEIKAFVIEDGSLFSPGLINRFSALIEKREYNRQKYLEQKQKVLIPATEKPNSVNGNTQYSRVEKRRVKKSKEPIINKYILPDWINKELWSEYKKMRLKIKKPMTDYAEKLAVKELEKLMAAGDGQDKIVKQSIQNSWQGLFPVKKNGMNQKAPNRVTTDTSKYGED